ncbi:hypothetical protein MMC11_007849 [Xylographa trunciseda]|nr:hypothetical protein [Xylographa trunciseda]
MLCATPYYAAKSQYRGLLTQSLCRGPSQPSLLAQTIPEHFSSIVEKFGGRTAVVSRHQKERLDYNALQSRSNALAVGLASIAVKKGDRVAVSLGNSIEYAIVTYSLFKLGAILVSPDTVMWGVLLELVYTKKEFTLSAVPLNPAFTTQQVISALNHLQVSCLIIGAETNLSRRPPISNVPLLKEIFEFSGPSVRPGNIVPSLRQVIIADNSSGRVNIGCLGNVLPFNDVLEYGYNGKEISTPSLHPDEVVNIQFTSGTTSMPKAACLTHRSILNNGNSIGDRMLLTEKDIVCCPPPLFHCFGCILGYMATATHGSAIVFPAEAFDPEATLRSVQEEQCTALYGVPTMFSAELELIQNGVVSTEGFQHLRTGIAAGSSIPAELMRKLHKTLNLTELTICYGMTETSPVSAMTTTDDPLEKRINSVGKLLPHVEAKIVDPGDRTKILPIGTRGELAVSGYLVMQGYWGDPEKTLEAMIADDNGKIWMHTGDEGAMDADGYVQITGRIKDLIIRGGENIHPLEVENCILGHPSVAEVSVVGLPDDRYGEVVAAFVVKNRHSGNITEKDVRAWVAERLSRHLVPKYVFWVDGYPKTASGKIQKFKLQTLGKGLVAKGKEREAGEIRKSSFF